ncbi:MAG: SUMF1/EgtB/PvdO family nonheme iron enzyme [Planctomyces sp.]
MKQPCLLLEGNRSGPQSRTAFGQSFRFSRPLIFALSAILVSDFCRPDLHQTVAAQKTPSSSASEKPETSPSQKSTSQKTPKSSQKSSPKKSVTPGSPSGKSPDPSGTKSTRPPGKAPSGTSPGNVKKSEKATGKSSTKQKTSGSGKASVPGSKTTKTHKLTPPHAGKKTGESWNGNPMKIEFLWCEPGSFVMGSPPTEKDRVANEEQVEVTLTKGFWLGKYEITQEQWKSVMNTEPWLDHRRVRIAPDSPACWISWDQARLFCQELTRREQATGSLPDDWAYVLPTEAQWEFACRAGTTTKFSFGDDDAKLIDYAWFGEQDRKPQQMHARAVGTKKPNPWGFHDMHGNVVEWCRDYYQEKYPGGTDPFVSVDPTTGVTGRGGEWRLPLNWSRSACRQKLGADGVAATIGFRLSLQQGVVIESPQIDQIRLAVIAFENKGRSLPHDRLGRTLSGLIAGNLSQYEGLEVLERQSAQGLQTEASLATQGKSTDGPDANSRESAQYVLTGTSAVEKDKFLVTATLSQIGLGKPLGEWKLSGSLNEIEKIEADLSAKIIKAFRIKEAPRSDATALGTQGSPVVAILPFLNDSPTAELDDLELGLAELLQSELSEVSGLQLVERQALEKILSEQNLTESGLIDDSTAVTLGKLAGANILLTGSFLELDSRLLIQVRTLNATTGTIIGTRRVSGPTSDFDDLIGKLTQQLTAGVSTEAADSGDPDQKSKDRGTPGAKRSTLEVAMHVAAARKFIREGNLAKARDSYENAILLAPDSPDMHLHLILLQEQLSDYDGMVRTGEHMLQAEEKFNRFQSRERFLISMVSACVSSDRVERAAAILEKYRSVSDTFRTYATSSIAQGYIRRKRYPEAVAIMELLAEEDVAKNGVLKSQALRGLFTFNFYHATSVVGIPIKDHQVATRKAIEIYERALDAAEKDKSDEKSRMAWAQTLIPLAVDILYMTDDNRKVAFLDDEKKAAFRKREAEVFGDNSEVRFRKMIEEALAAESSGKHQDAVDGFRKYLDESVDLSNDYIQPTPVQFTHFSDWIDLRIEAQSRMARILANDLKQPEEARKVLTAMLEEHGLVHFAGPEAMILMNQLKMEPVIPKNAVLVWGGSGTNYYGWKRVLNAEQLQMHGVRRPLVTLADLAAYPVVVLNDSSSFPMLPSEILALRNYVASGGSLLVIVSSSWAPESPTTRVELLSFFDMTVTGSPTKSSGSTQIVPHPITEGISSFTAWNAAGLRAPDESVLIRSGENTILAARGYGRGRVVVSTAGQWFTPEILLIPENDAPRNVVTTQHGAGDPTFFRPPTPEPPLLRQVVRWLGEVHDTDKDYNDWHAEWKQVLAKVQQAQACLYPASHRIVSWDELPPLFENLINSAAAPDLKLESLWSAGESLVSGSVVHETLNEQGFPVRAPYNTLYSSRQYDGESLSLHPEYFQRIVDSSEKGALRECAVLRLIDCRRVEAMSQNFSGHEDLARAVAQIVDQYRKAEFEKGSWAHAWGMLRCGQLLMSVDEYDPATACFDEVGENAPESAPKALALLNAARGYALDENYDEALRRLSQAESMPGFIWHGHYRQFEPNCEAMSAFLRESRTASATAIRELREQIPKLKSDASFLDWKKRLKVFKETGVMTPPANSE